MSINVTDQAESTKIKTSKHFFRRKVVQKK